jgi:hypothetical protein
VQSNAGGHFSASEGNFNYGVISLTDSGTGSPTTNIGGYFSASSATNNYGLLVANGDVGIGDIGPDLKLEIAGSSGDGYFGVSSLATSDGNIFIIDSSGDVGIGTTSPSAKFDVEVSSGGAATIGSSTASASGIYAVSLNQATASGASSVALNLATASGASSVALHMGVASGEYSFATGIGSEASGLGSIATGLLSTASDTYAVALGGIWTSASGEYSIAVGSQVTASADNSIAIGNCVSDTNLDNNIEDSLMIGFNSAATVYVDGSRVGIKDTTPDALLDYDFSSTSTTAGTEYGSYFKSLDTGAVSTGTDITYGTYNEIIRTGTTGGTHSTYGEYIDVTQTTLSDAVLNTYGEYIDLTTTSGGFNTAYGLYVNLDGNANTNYAGIFMGGNVGIGIASPNSILEIADSSQNTWITMDEADANPTSTQLDQDDSISIYNKADKLVFAYNNGGTITYLTIPLDGSTTTWTQTTTAP